VKYRKLIEGLNGKGSLIPFNANVYDYIKTLDKDHYLGIYIYTEEQKKKFYSKIEKIKDGKVIETINGAAGILDVYTDKLVFDFDLKAGNLESAQSDTLEAVTRLQGLGVDADDIEITFSGNKGFGLIVNIDGTMTPDEHKKLAKELCGDLASFDTTIYNPSRILRVAGTKHQSSGLHKTFLSYEELVDSSIDEIKEWAKEPFDDNEYPEFAKVKFSDEMKKMIAKEPAKKKESSSTLLYDGICTLDFSNRPKWLSPWKYALSEGYFPAGSRNYALLILTATYRGQGMSKTNAYHLVKGAADLQSQRTETDKFSKDEIWKNMIEVVYSVSWNGGTYSEDNFPDELKEYMISLGIERTSKDGEEDERMVERLGDGFDAFANYAATIEEHTIKTGIPELDDRLKIRAGQLIFILAPPSVGKTSALITILNNTSKDGIHSYFSSMDMYVNEIYKKLIQRHTALTEDEVFDVFVRNDTKKMEEFRQILKEEYNNVNLCYKSGESVNQMRRSIEKIESSTGNKIDLVAVDYLELVLTEAGDPTSATAESAQALRELANEGRTVICLLQPNKNNSHPTEAITSYNAAKGSSSISQACTAFLTANRPGMNSSNDNVDDHFFSMNCVKNRNGALFSINMGWDGPTQTFYSLDDEQKAELKRLRDRQHEKKLAEAGIL